MQHERSRPDSHVSAVAKRRLDVSGFTGIQGRWTVVARREGKILWEDEIENTVVDAGLNELLGVTLTRETQTNTWHILVTSGAPTPNAADTMASHAGWEEYTGFSDATRGVWVGSRDATAQATNPTAVQYTFNATGTVGGAGLVSTNSLGGSTGTLYAVGVFTGGSKVLNSGDTLDVTATFTNTPV